MSLSVPNRSRCALTLQMSSLPRIQFVILCSAPALPFVDLRVSVCHRNSCLWKVYGYCNRAVIIDNKKSENMQFISIFKLIKILLSIYFTTRLPRKKNDPMPFVVYIWPRSMIFCAFLPHRSYHLWETRLIWLRNERAVVLYY